MLSMLWILRWLCEIYLVPIRYFNSRGNPWVEFFFISLHLLNHMWEKLLSSEVTLHLFQKSNSTDHQKLINLINELLGIILNLTMKLWGNHSSNDPHTIYLHTNIWVHRNNKMPIGLRHHNLDQQWKHIPSQVLSIKHRRLL